jgi:hypothetical protein
MQASTNTRAKLTAKKIKVGDMIGLMHNFIGCTTDNEYIFDTDSPLAPAIRGWVDYVCEYKTIIEVSATKQGSRTVTIVTCEDGSTYELNSRNAYEAKVAH